MDKTKAWLKKSLQVLTISILTIVVAGSILIFSGNLRLEDNQGNNILLGRRNDESVLSLDGPYLRYLGEDSLHVVSVLEGSEKNYSIRKKTYSITNRDSLSFTVNVNVKEADKRFTFALHSEIKVPPTYYDAPQKMLVLSDIEGNFYAFEKLLKSQGVINDQYEWTFGSNHLVLAGDFFDRGLQVTQCLWLIYKLEQQAVSEGGRVHFILGNHEVMNLRGNQAYVREKYKILAEKLNREYTSFFNPDTELGRWLRTKNVVEKIGNVIFTHGGLSPKISKSGLSLKEINRVARKNFGNDELHGQNVQLILKQNGPMWYRGYFNDEKVVSQMDSILSTYQADHIVVGHTVVDEIHAGFDQQVYAIDVEQPKEDSDKPARALLINSGEFYKVDSAGNRVILGD